MNTKKMNGLPYYCDNHKCSTVYAETLKANNHETGGDEGVVVGGEGLMVHKEQKKSQKTKQKLSSVGLQWPVSVCTF